MKFGTISLYEGGDQKVNREKKSNSKKQPVVDFDHWETSSLKKHMYQNNLKLTPKI